MRRFTILIIISCFMFACQGETPTGSTADLDTLYSWMSGSFASTTQAAADSNYFDIRLEMIPIWQNHPGHWLYVEQAVAGYEDRPYRQRVYELEQGPEDTLLSHVYLLPRPERFIQQPAALNQLTPDSLIDRAGCSIHLVRRDSAFVGGTQGRQCVSSLHGATYATSNVEVRPDRLTSWDQGFDLADIQVWGAEQGGYVFDKIAAK